MASWKLTIEYDGTRYHGWQEQKNARTIAGVIRTAAVDLLGGPVDLGGAGRTDAGVHALAQVAHLRTTRRIARDRLLHGLNDRLPNDINILSAEPATAGFDARRDAVRRCYLYQIATRRTAFAKRYVWWVKDRLNVDRMAEASRVIAGSHDFAVFCDKRQDEKSTLVLVDRVELGVEGNNLLNFRIGASHFLWKMVRRLVGMLVEIGRGRASAEYFKALLDPNTSISIESARKAVAAQTAPASGLFLEQVVYSVYSENP